MLPAEQITKFMRANEFLFPKNGEGAMAKQLGHGADDSLRQVVKTTVANKPSAAVGDEHVEMEMEDEVIAKSMNCGDCPEFAFGILHMKIIRGGYPPQALVALHSGS